MNRLKLTLSLLGKVNLNNLILFRNFLINLILLLRGGQFQWKKMIPFLIKGTGIEGYHLVTGFEKMCRPVKMRVLRTLCGDIGENCPLIRDRESLLIQRSVVSQYFRRQFWIDCTEAELDILSHYSNFSWLGDKLLELASVHSDSESSEEDQLLCKRTYRTLILGLQMVLVLNQGDKNRENWNSYYKLFKREGRDLRDKNLELFYNLQLHRLEDEYGDRQLTLYINSVMLSGSNETLFRQLRERYEEGRGGEEL